MVTSPHFAVAQEPDAEHSQDRAFITPHAAVVLDGATPFVPVDVDTATYVDTLGGHIVDALGQEPAGDLGDLVAESIRLTTQVLDLHPGNAPSSTVAILRVRPDVVDLYALGDGAIYYGKDRAALELTDLRVSELGIPEHDQYRERLGKGHGYDDQHREIVNRLQRKQRRRRNRPDGYWIAEADAEAAQHALTRTLPPDAISWAVLATDGAYVPLRHLGLDAWHSVAHADAASLAALLRRCVDWESVTDPDGQELPRAKMSDDKTLLAVLLDSA